MSGRSIRARLAVWSLLLVAAATIVCGAGSWVVLRRVVIANADATLRTRVAGVRAFAERAIALPHEDLLDEFQEYAQLTPGDALLDVRDEAGTQFCEPPLPGWRAVRDRVAAATPAGATVFETDAIDAHRYRVVSSAFLVRDTRLSMTAAVPLEASFAIVSTFGWTVAGLVPVIVIVAGAGAYVLSRRALAPVDRLTETIEAITLRRLDRRIDVPAEDVELRRLAATFNDMLARLHAAVTEMTRLTAEASHELRTPVALVRTTAELALTRDRTADEYRQALADVLTQAEHMSSLVGNLLSLARDDAGAGAEDAQDPVDLAALVSAVAHGTEAAIVQRGLILDVQIADRPVVAGSAPALGRLALILIDNAMKHGADGGRIDVRVDRVVRDGAGDRARIRVVDAGRGIPAGERDRVFERFYRGTAARAGGAEGTGLGLAIARTIASRHGGEIAIEDGPGGRGVAVEVTLPVAPGAAQNLN